MLYTVKLVLKNKTISYQNTQIYIFYILSSNQLLHLPDCYIFLNWKHYRDVTANV